MSDFSSKILCIKSDLQDMKLSGMDVSKYEEMLNEVVNDGGAADIQEINQIISRLNGELGLRKIMEYTSCLTYLNNGTEFEKCISVIRGLNSIDYKIKILNEELVQNIYGSIYTIMKKEIEMGKQTILGNVNLFEESIYYINSYIIKDIEECNNTNMGIVGINELNVLFNESRNNSLKSISFDVLKQLVFVCNYDTNLKKYNDYLSEQKGKIEPLMESMKIETEREKYNLEYIISKINNKVEEISKNVDKATARIVSLILSSLLVGGTGIAIPIVTKNSFKTEMFKTITSIYTSDGKEMPPIVDYQEKIEEDKTKILKIEESAENTRKYDLTNIQLDTTYDFLHLDVDYYNLQPYYSLLSNYKDVIERRTFIEQEETPSYVLDDEKSRRNLIILLYALLAGSTLLPFMPIGILRKIIRASKYEARYENDYNALTREVALIYENYKERIEKSEQLIREFNRLVRDGIKLYVSGEIFEEVEKLIKELENKTEGLKKEFKYPYILR